MGFCRPRHAGSLCSLDSPTLANPQRQHARPLTGPHPEVPCSRRGVAAASISLFAWVPYPLKSDRANVRFQLNQHSGVLTKIMSLPVCGGTEGVKDSMLIPFGECG